MKGDAAEALRGALQRGRDAGVTREDIARLVGDLVDEIFEVRRINGYEVVPGWTMPTCPPEIEGARLSIDAHGNDGFECYWWRDDWGACSSFHLAKKAMDAAGIDPFLDGDEHRAALVDPDPHDDACLNAYSQLGFYA